MNRLQSFLHHPTTLILGFVLVVSYLTYVQGYTNPPHLFWDENYHISSAQKYLTGTYFMEPHPPLGKMFVALGEQIIDANPGADDDFIDTDYARNLPDDFSFAGYRLFPVLFGWLTAPVLFCIFLLITRKRIFAMLLSFLYIFDNALLVHARSAMLDSTLLFFVCLTILAFLIAFTWKEDAKRFRWAAILFGLAFAGAVLSKANGLIVILLVPFLLWKIRKDPRKIATFCFWSSGVFLVLYCFTWYLHFNIGTAVNTSLPDNGYYQASSEYQEILNSGTTASLGSFSIMLRDSLNFLPHYSRGVPRLDLCKLDENGSPFFFWPLGARSINYRWETPDGYSYQYLYLQANPAVWWVSFAAVIITGMLLGGSLLFPLREPLKNPYLLTTFFVMYGSYMVAIARLDRVMYLYHYFIPLIFSFILVALVWEELRSFGKKVLTEDHKLWGLLGLACLIFLSFQWYRPLTFYEPITDEQVTARAFFPLWELHCVKCPKKSMLVIPRAKKT